MGSGCWRAALKSGNDATDIPAMFSARSLAPILLMLGVPLVPDAPQIAVHSDPVTRVSVQAIAASPRVVVEELAMRVGFVLTGAEELSATPRRWVVDRRPVAEVLAEVLAAEHLSYVIVSVGTRRTVQSVTIARRAGRPSI